MSLHRASQTSHISAADWEVIDAGNYNGDLPGIRHRAAVSIKHIVLANRYAIMIQSVTSSSVMRNLLKSSKTAG